MHWDSGTSSQEQTGIIISMYCGKTSTQVSKQIGKQKRVVRSVWGKWEQGDKIGRLRKE